MRPTAVLLVALVPLLLVLISPSATDAARSPSFGGWSPIKDLQNPYVLEVATFAVTKYNKGIINGKLELVRVVNGETQMEGGTIYRLVLEAKDNAHGVARYEAVVWDSPWEKVRKLTSFVLFKA